MPATPAGPPAVTTAASQKAIHVASARERFRRVVVLLVRVLEVYTTVLMVTMAIIVLLGVFYRYVVQRALPWYDEFAEFLLVWLTFYGSVLAAERRAHIGFETLTEYLPPSLRRILAVMAEVIVLLIQVALFVYGWTLVRAASFDTALSLRWVRLSWIYSAIPISGVLMFLISLRHLLRLVWGPGRGAAVPP